MKDFSFWIISILGSLASIISLIWGIGKYLHNRRLKYQNPFDNLSKIREKEIRRIVGQIRSGQSSAIIGVFEQEKTAILAALNDQEYSDKADRLIFSDLDISSLDVDCDPEKFWKQALKPLKVNIEKQRQDDFWLRRLRWLLRRNVSPQVAKAYKECQNNQFEEFYLKELFKQLKKDNRQLVLMIDRFDLLLQRKNLKRTHFLGNLREIASCYPSSLNLVITLSMLLQQFHQKNKELNPGGSPYFNFIDANQVSLAVLSEAEIDKLLQQSERKLTNEACDFIKNAAGGHPYLLRVATNVWWNAYDDDNKKNKVKNATKEFSNRISNLLDEILQYCSKNTCKAFLSLMQKREISGFVNELKELTKQGLIIENNGVWQIHPSIFSSLLAEKAMQKLRESINGGM
ncbi:MAG: hypothetical protein DRR16_24695 [Candidatus Parabeggiatoa sp. nov. 3]|nr:MAG: hypothetical protein DRR00_21715 [Gammaproteobacteria bacterium]RKZ64111.1 MAG: hypothetical protein DRQ99_15990 [Gammaproteobacteria bacterium]RKZ79986.1 MAG: hypothetical protein DRR16_24695 [Gammaproteobacteria bacterium]HEW91737.1 hypothetical protein [Thermotogaceae bacterium]